MTAAPAATGATKRCPDLWEATEHIAHSVGASHLHIDAAVQLGADADEDLRHLHALRELTAAVHTLTWTLHGQLAWPLLLLAHIVAPSAGTTRDAHRTATRWRSLYRYGSLFYRVGPGFVQVKDIRQPSQAAKFTIEGDDGLVFADLAGRGLCLTDDADASVWEALRNNGLAIQGEHQHLVLPFRMRRWPVPFLAV